MNRNQLTYEIRGAAFAVHRALGPGLLESAYEKCLIYELRKRGYLVKSQVSLPIVYDNQKIDVGYRIDLLVENEIIVELKSVEELAPVHTAQLLTYLKLAGKPLGLLMNFNVANMQHGIKRYILETALGSRKDQ
ncbi:GxxExxY protein [Lewinella aquimaris]|uniref:GxxExxY protein n=1 Tax=Neolewinella aquimaris TaxID=1835722 RepID=A0A840ECX7_9BACT|nr:GxxExxY protein [Neolewinella aquimaris]MBB4078806.1 GxxExxY protein [Neolewinella aquimaris]